MFILRLSYRCKSIYSGVFIFYSIFVTKKNLACPCIDSLVVMVSKRKRGAANTLTKIN